MTWDLGSIASGASETVELVVQVNAGRTADISNTASVSSSITDPAGGNNSVTQTTGVSTSADLAITKSDSADPVAVGQPLTYTLTISNAGPSDAQDVVVTDTLPADVTFGSATPSQGTCSEVAGTVTCSLGVLGASGSASVQIVVTPTAAAGDAGSISNTAWVSSSTSDPVAGNDSATETTAVTPIADLWVSIDDGTTSVTAGTPTTYTVTVGNDGPSDLPAGAQVEVPVPAGTAVAALGSGCAVSSGIVTCTAGPVATGGSVSFWLTLDVLPGYLLPTLEASAAVVSSPYADLDPSDDTDTDTDDVDSEADVAISVADGEISVTAGDGFTYTYTITVVNGGPSTAQGIVVSGTWPSTFARGPLPGGCVDVGGGPDFTCTVPNLPPGGNAEILVGYSVPAAAPAGPVTMTAAVSAANDPNPANDLNTDGTTVDTSADLSVTGVATTPVAAGGTITYTYTIVNDGPSVARDVGFFDDLPPELGFVSAASTVGVCGVADPLTCLIGDLGPGNSVTVTVVAVAPAEPGTYVDDVEVASSTADPDAANNTTSTDVVVTPVADLAVSIDDGVGQVTAGTSTTYTITLSNDGPSEVPAGVVIEVPVPAGTSGSTTSAGCVIAGGVLTCTSTAPIAAGGSASFELTLEVSPGYLLAALQATAEIASSPYADPDAGNDTDSDTDAVDSLAAVSIAVSDGEVSVTAGDGGTHTYVVVVANGGPSTASGLQVALTWPAGLTQGPLPAGCTELGGGPDLVCTLADIAQGETAEIQVTYT
ncbi:MAG TPA: hypothetical protein VGA36_00865, partial [Nitriliruptorales bacterium]